MLDSADSLADPFSGLASSILMLIGSSVVLVGRGIAWLARGLMRLLDTIRPHARHLPESAPAWCLVAENLSDPGKSRWWQTTSYGAAIHAMAEVADALEDGIRIEAPAHALRITGRPPHSRPDTSESQ